MAITDNLIAYWKLDEASGDRADSYGSETLIDGGSHGRVAGPGNLPWAVQIANGSSLTKVSDSNLQNTGPFTVVGWFKLTGLSAAKYPTLIGKSPPTVEWTLGFNGDNMNLNLAVSPDTTNLTWVSSTTLSNGTWYFFVAGYDGSQTFFYTNNGTPNTTTYSSGIYSGSNTLYLGWAFDGGTEVDIAGVAFWKRALTSNERSWLYNAGSGQSNYLSYPGEPRNASPISRVAVHRAANW